MRVVIWSAFQQHAKHHVIQLPGAHFSSMGTRPGTAHFSSICGRLCGPHFGSMRKTMSYNYLVHISAACELGRAPHISEHVREIMWSAFRQHAKGHSYNYLVHITAACEPCRLPSIAHFSSMCGVYVVRISAGCERPFIQLPGAHFSSM